MESQPLDERVGLGLLVFAEGEGPYGRCRGKLLGDIHEDLNGVDLQEVYLPDVVHLMGEEEID